MQVTQQHMQLSPRHLQTEAHLFHREPRSTPANRTSKLTRSHRLRGQRLRSFYLAPLIVQVVHRASIIVSLPQVISSAIIWLQSFIVLVQPLTVMTRTFQMQRRQTKVYNLVIVRQMIVSPLETG